MATMESSAQLDDAWKAHRPYLVGLAFRMLGDIGEAEDVVQEAFTRLFRMGLDDVDDLRGWLIVVTSRLCLDQIKSARARREAPSQAVVEGGAATGLGRVAGEAPLDPADRVTLDDTVRLALLVVLDRLTPAERVAFVLHDIFEMPFDTIAETVGRSTAACRQLASRGRQKLEEGRGSLPSASAPLQAEQRDVLERFVTATLTGDMQGLLAVLDPDVTGGVDIRPTLLVEGASDVSSNLLRFWFSPRASLVPLAGGGSPCVLAFFDRELAGVFVLDITDRRITEIHGILDPSKLDFVREGLSAERA